MAKRGCLPLSSRRTEWPSRRRTIDMIEPPKPEPNTTNSNESAIATNRAGDWLLDALCEIHPFDARFPRFETVSAARESLQVPCVGEASSTVLAQADLVSFFEFSQGWGTRQVHGDELINRAVPWSQWN